MTHTEAVQRAAKKLSEEIRERSRNGMFATVGVAGDKLKLYLHKRSVPRKFEIMTDYDGIVVEVEYVGKIRAC
jgi:hypothetical protein